jgi:hypothetical protein
MMSVTMARLQSEPAPVVGNELEPPPELLPDELPPDVVELPLAATVKAISPFVWPLSSSVTATHLIVYFPSASADVVMFITVRSPRSTADVTPDMVDPSGPTSWADDWSGLIASLKFKVICAMPACTVEPAAGVELVISACAHAPAGATVSISRKAVRPSAKLDDKR